MRCSGHKVGSSASFVIFREVPLSRQSTYLNRCFSIWFLPSASFLIQQWRSATALVFVEYFGMFGHRLLHSLQAQSLGILLHFPSWPLWLLQRVVTSNNLLATRYVDRYEGGIPCWSQLPWLANHYIPGQTLSPSQTQPETWVTADSSTTEGKRQDLLVIWQSR